MTPTPAYTARRVCVLAVVPDIAEVAAKTGREINTSEIVRLIPNVRLVVNTLTGSKTWRIRRHDRRSN